MSSLLLVLWLYVASSIITKQTILSPQTAAHNDSFLTLNPDSTSIIPYIYYIVRVFSQDSYDIKLSFDNSYGFDTSLSSTFSLTINGFTPFIHRNTDFIFVFSVGDLQYFSFLLHLDEYNNIFNKIYLPKHVQNVSEWLSNPNKISTSTNEWIVLNQHQSLWPLKFVITNNPETGQSIFEFYHNISCTLSVRYKFDKLFDANKDINIYLMGQTIKQQFYISSFDILLTTNNVSISTYNTTSLPDLETITNPATNQSTNLNVNLSETILSAVQSETPHVHKLFNNTIKSQAIMFIVIILLTVTIFWIIIRVLRRFCKPVEENSTRKKSYESYENNENDENDENEDDPDLESENNENDNEYMNEGVLATGCMTTLDVSKPNAMKIDVMRLMPKYSMSIISNVECRKNKDDSALICGDNNDNNIQKNIIPFEEKENMDQFIGMINDDDKEVIVRKISDEINYCVSFNYCDEMLS